MAAVWARLTFQVWEYLPIFEVTRQMRESNGFAGCYFSQVTESPEHVILLLIWNERARFDTYIKSEDYKLFSATLSSIDSKLGVVDFRCGSRSFSDALEGHNEIHIVYFPASYSTREKENLVNISCMFPILSYAGSDTISQGQTFASRERPSCGWFKQKLDYHGHKLAASIFIHHWTSPAKEKQFKMIAPGWPDEDENEIPKSTTKFTRDLRRAGALDWETFHVHFKRAW